MIYFILNKGENVVKIGFTNKDVKKRLSTLQVGNHTKLELIAVIKGDLEKEKYYHELFQEYRQQGEWFYFGEKLQDFLNDLKNDKTLTDPQNIFSSSFKFYMNNSNLEWLKKFNNLTEFQVLHLLMSYEDPKNGVVYVDSMRKEEMAKYLELSIPSIVKALENLRLNDCIVRVRRGCYMVNPTILFQGEKCDLQNKIDKYMKYANLDSYIEK